MLGIIGAMDIEVNDIKAKMENPVERTISSVCFTSGIIGGTECVVAKCGIGKVNAALCTQTMILEYKPDRIINTGIAGSTSTKTHIGSVVIAESVVQHDFDTTMLGDEPGMLFLPGESLVYIPADKATVQELEAVCSALDDIDYTVGTVATGDQFIGTLEKRTEINKRFGAIACEMEGGSIAQVCYVNKVPYCILRSISDDSSGNEGAQVEYETFAHSAAQKAVEIICAFIKDTGSEM